MITSDTLLKYLKPLSPVPTDMKPGGKLRHPIQCVLFDIYGTLFISGSGDIGIARQKKQINSDLTELLSKFSIGRDPEILKQCLYDTIEDAHKRLRRNGIDFPEIEIDRIWMEVLGWKEPDKARDFAFEYELIVNPVYPMPHLKELLSHCKGRNISMGIISNAQFFTPYLFSWFLDKDPVKLGFHPDLLIYSYRLGYAKPSLHLFKQAAETLDAMKIPIPSVLYIGNDKRNDVHPAQKIGFQTALFAGDQRSLRLRLDDLVCREIEPDLVITDLIQLMDYI